MVEKRRAAGNEVTAASLNESTDLDSLLSAILGDRADDTVHDEPPRPANGATFRFAGFEQPILTDHGPAAPEDGDGLAGRHSDWRCSTIRTDRMYARLNGHLRKAIANRSKKRRATTSTGVGRRGMGDREYCSR